MSLSLIEAHRRLGREGQELVVDRARDPGCSVDPELGVEGPAPATAPRSPSPGEIYGVEQHAVAELDVEMDEERY